MSKTKINNAIEAAEHPILLESAEQLEEAGKTWSRRSILGLDTEFVRERTYRADLGLVQISDGEKAWLVDPLAVENPEPLVRMFKNPEILKLLHSGSEDIEVLMNAVGAIPGPLIDTQMACAMQGQSLQLGYHHAIKWLFGVEIDKDQTRSNWCKRPLTERQLHYAAMDVVLLPEMLRNLRPKLEEAGRWHWLEEDVARMQRNALARVDPDFAYLRFSSLERTDEETRQALRYLARWREHTAERKNLARGFVIPDKVLLQLARVRPATGNEMRNIDGFHPRAMARYRDDVLELIQQAARDRSPVKVLEQLDSRQSQQLKEMRNIIQKRSAELKIDSALLASRRELEKLIRAQAVGEALPERFLGWRKEVITDQLLAVGQP